MKADHIYFLIAFISSSFHLLESAILASKAPVLTTCAKPGTLALTFDDGPFIYENIISDYLHDRQIKGSFFVNGNNYNCIYDEDMVAKLRHTFSQGHLIGSHTWSHPDIATLTSEQFDQQLALVETALIKILGIKPKYFRPPYGSYNADNLAVLATRGYTMVNWSFDSGDSTGTAAEDSKNLYTDLAKKYPSPQIALNHETIQTTSQTVVPYAVSVLGQAGYKLVHVSECLGTGTRNEDLYQWVGSPSARDSSWTCEGTPGSA